MSRIYLMKRGLIRSLRYSDRAELMDAITELQLENSLLRDELEACRELLEAKGNLVNEIQKKLRKADIKIEHLKMELEITNASLDILTEKK